MAAIPSSVLADDLDQWDPHSQHVEYASVTCFFTFSFREQHGRGSGVQDIMMLYQLRNDMYYETIKPLGQWYDVIDELYMLRPALLAPNF